MSYATVEECCKQYTAGIINLSLSSGMCPTKLKMAKIIPIFKAEDNTNANNYRPISLLSNFNRIFEKLVYSRMESFIEQNDLYFLHLKMVSAKRIQHSVQFLTL